MTRTRPRCRTETDSPSQGKCDWIAISMSITAISTYVAEYWWASHWFAFG